MVNSISLLAIAGLATTASADLTSVFSKVSGIEHAVVNAAQAVTTQRSLAAGVTYDSVNKEFTPYTSDATLSGPTECCYKAGEPGNEKAKEGEVDKCVPGVWGLEWNDKLELVSKCVSNDEICEDLSHEMCTTFYKKAKTLMTLLGWDGKTTLQSVYDQVKDQAGVKDEIDVTDHADGSVSIEGYNLGVYRIGDVCPVSAGMCDDKVTATFAFESSDSASALQAELIRQACIGAGRGFWKEGSTAAHTQPNLAKCKYSAPASAAGRRLASNEVSVQGSITGMNQLLSAMVDEGSAVSKLAAEPTLGQTMVTPTATVTTDKETNEGGALDLITLAALALLVLVLIIVCCCCCCCKICNCCCFKKAAKKDSMSHMEMSGAVVN